MARHTPTPTLRLQYVRLPDAERRLQQVFALLAKTPCEPALPTADRLIPQREGGNDNARGFVCPSLSDPAATRGEH